MHVDTRVLPKEKIVRNREFKRTEELGLISQRARMSAKYSSLSRLFWVPRMLEKQRLFCRAGLVVFSLLLYLEESRRQKIVPVGRLISWELAQTAA